MSLATKYNVAIAIVSARNISNLGNRSSKWACVVIACASVALGIGCSGDSPANVDAGIEPAYDAIAIPDANTPITYTGSIRQIGVGRYHMCALMTAGTVRCWGRRADWGNLGYGNEEIIGDDELPVAAGDVDVGGTVKQIAVGWYHTCALLDSGAVRCWGDNEDGQLGYGHTEDIGDDELPSSAGDVDVGGAVTQIVAGDSHTCALLETGAVRCWGSNFFSQLGFQQQVKATDTPSTLGDVDIGGTATQIAVGAVHSCALLTSGSVRCWGAEHYGGLGYGNEERIGDDEMPAAAGDVDVGADAAIVEIKAGFFQTCVRLETGKLRCWGKAMSLGLGGVEDIGDDEVPATTPDIDVGGKVVNVMTTGGEGDEHTCAVLDTGALRCWGGQEYGVLGYP